MSNTLQRTKAAEGVEKRELSSIDAGMPTGTATMETVYMHARAFQSCLTLFDPMDCNPPGSSVHGILQARNTGVGCLQGIFPTQGSNPRLFTVLAGRFFTTSITWEAHGNSVELP